ncbi:hypothetical protein ILUMI_24735 [Ignelater luminosus]|uniref:RNase H type-1 domain-containing protein n=1 Tax=Ignelater luminosus TaxID=2038154 RepID=A0A8K0C8L8_IGNLU|nr:hypothetical protein ILUMI_24735 [Ignelater luminosus]
MAECGEDLCGMRLSARVVPGPTLWTVLMEGWFQKINQTVRERELDGVAVQAFADDQVIVPSARSVKKLEKAWKIVIEACEQWAVTRKLRYNRNKTQVTFCNGTSAIREPPDSEALKRTPAAISAGDLQMLSNHTHQRYGGADERTAIMDCSESPTHGVYSYPAGRGVNLFADSQSALAAIIGPEPNTQLALTARKKIQALRRDGTEVTLHWIRAHVGHMGNEETDERAREATQREIANIFIPPRSHYKYLAWKEVTRTWRST